MPPLPSDFNPAVATDAEFARYGIPPRPSQKLNPSLYQKWLETFGGSNTFLAPQFMPSPSRLRSHRSIVDGENSTNWSGVTVNAPSDDSINVAVAAKWTLPGLTSLGSGVQHIGIWIGIDGNPSAGGLVQAGVNGSIASTGPAAFSAFAEWLSPTDTVPANSLSNFPVNAGDSIEVEIWVTSSTTATLVMKNLSSGKPAVLWPMVSPPGGAISGQAAEWIVERPVVGNNPDDLSTLADYSAVVFSDAMAWAQAQSFKGNMSLKTFAKKRGFTPPVSVHSIGTALDFVDPMSLRAILHESATVEAGSGSTINMANGGTTLSTAQIMGDSKIRCQYTGPQPSK